MTGLPVCPYCDAEVPAHILKAHMAICSDSQRSTPVRPTYLASSATASVSGLGYYTSLTRRLPTYKPQQALDDAALEALLSPRTDTSQLLHSLMPSYDTVVPAARRSSRPLPPPPPTTVSTSLFPTESTPRRSGLASRDPLRDSGPTQTRAAPAAAVAPLAEASSARRSTPSYPVRDSTRRPSPLEPAATEAVAPTRPEVSSSCGSLAQAGVPGLALSRAQAALPDGTRDRVAFLELTCGELREQVHRLQRESRSQQERHDVLEEALYALLQPPPHAPQTFAIAAAAPHAAATGGDWTHAPPRPPAAPSRAMEGAGHFSDIDLLGGGSGGGGGGHQQEYFEGDLGSAGPGSMYRASPSWPPPTSTFY